MGLIEIVAGVQPLLVGAILLWAGMPKLLSSGVAETVGSSALTLLLNGEKRAVVTYRVTGIMEIGVAALLLLPPFWKWEMGLAVALAGAFVAYLLYSHKVAPERPCGCLGGFGSEVAISWRGLTRAGLLVLFGVLGLMAQSFWFAALAFGAPWSFGIIVLEMALLLILSPELDKVWTRYTRRALWRLRARRIDYASAEAPFEKTLRRLKGSEPFGTLSGILRSGPRDWWREGAWSFLSFDAEYEGSIATAVFAVPVREDPDWIRAAVVNEADGTILFSVGPGGDGEERSASPLSSTEGAANRT